MSNQVDTSDETFNREWARIVKEHQVLSEESDPAPLEPVDSEGSSEQDVLGDVRLLAPPINKQDGATLEEKIKVAEMVINGGLVFVFDAIGGLNIQADKYQRMAHSWAVVIAKRFEGGIFEFMAKYEDEIAAIGAAFIFFGAVRESARIKREEKACEEKVVRKRPSDQGTNDVKH